jgi:hypothetical protein
VLDLGASDGANFPHFPASVDEVVAVEPEHYLRDRAWRNAELASVPIRVVDVLVDSLRFADSLSRPGLVALVLCTVADQVGALDELRTVIRLCVTPCPLAAPVAPQIRAIARHRN